MEMATVVRLQQQQWKQMQALAIVTASTLLRCPNVCVCPIQASQRDSTQSDELVLPTSRDGYLVLQLSEANKSTAKKRVTIGNTLVYVKVCTRNGANDSAVLSSPGRREYLKSPAIVG